jgi:hypothetical protein
MGRQGRLAMRCNALYDPALVIGFSFAFDYGDGASGAFTDTGSQAIAQAVADQSGLAVDDLDSRFMATTGAQAAAIAELLVNFNYGSLGHVCNPPGLLDKHLACPSTPVVQSARYRQA